jgi:hypothetical protein
MDKRYAPYIVILVLCTLLFLQRSCKGDKIVYRDNIIKQYDTIFSPKEIETKIVTKYKTIKGDTITIKGRVDTVVVKEFEKSTDSTKTQMFIDATKIRQYTNDFNDSVADVSIFTETKGELLKIAPKITIKARLPEKKTVFALYGGGGMYLDRSFNIGYKLNFRFQNKRGDLMSGSYDPVNKVIFAEYDFRFINIKK